MSFLNDEIKRRALSLNLTEIGFCTHKGKKAVCVLFPYFFGGEKEGGLSMYTRGRDYHKVAKEKLSLLLAPFTDDAEIFVDTGPKDNLEVALKCGLGVLGRNSLLINENLGSWIFIGYALTDLPLDDSAPLNGSCINCGRCVKSCPGGALKDGFDINLCASHISQKNGDLSEKEKSILKKSGYIFGCDVCQTVCPMNVNIKDGLSEFSENRIYSLKADELSDMTNACFSEKYGDYAFSWRKKNIIIRNISIIEE